jgi:ribosomal RNA assembly protein
METIFIENPRRIRANKEAIENKTGVNIEIKGRQVTIEGETIQEYEARCIIEAFDFGFDLKDALSLTSETIIFRKLNIKDFTRRKDLEEVRGRIIGTEGKTKRALESVSGCAVVLHDNAVGIIGPAETIEEATTAIGNLIRGSKQANIYRFLERMNTERKIKSDLGLKEDKKDKENEDSEEDEEESEEEN